MTPFDYLNNINQGQTGSTLDTSDYVPFMINRGLSYHQDTILLANEMNRYPNTPHKMQYDFFKNSVRPRKRFAKWHKSEKITKNIEIVMKVYNYSREKAESVIDLLTEDQLKELHLHRYYG